MVLLLWFACIATRHPFSRVIVLLPDTGSNKRFGCAHRPPPDGFRGAFRLAMLGAASA